MLKRNQPHLPLLDWVLARANKFMALIAIRELDELTTVYTGWILVEPQDENAMQQSQNAAIMHGIEQMTGELKFSKWNLKMIKPLQKVKVNYPVIYFNGNIFGHLKQLLSALFS